MTGVLLLWGEDPFLLREAALEALDGVRAAEVDAEDWRGGELADLATPSLFGEPRALMVWDVRSLPKDATAEVAAYVAAPDADATLLLCCLVPERGKVPAALVKLVEPTGEVRRVALERKEVEPWLARRASALGIELAPSAARAVVETVGADAGQLAAAVDQLADAFPGGRVGPQQVHAQFRGLGEQKTWDLCDRAFGKDLAGAIRSLRAIEEAGDDPLMVLGGIASRLRDLIRVRSLPDRLPPRDLAARAGLRFEWQARRLSQQARNFSLGELARLHARIAEADRALKSGGTSEVVLPVLVTEIAAPAA